MHDLTDGSLAEVLDVAQYQNDYETNFWKIGSSGFWKLERRQFFIEAGYPPYDAFDDGDWQRSLTLIETERSRIRDYFSKVAEHGITFNRVRVADAVISPYLQWEFHMLRLRAECGESIRVLPSAEVHVWERDELLPETVVHGDLAVYQPQYNADNSIDRVLKFTDPDTVLRCRRFIESLYRSGEDLNEFFEREIVNSAAPC